MTSEPRPDAESAPEPRPEPAPEAGSEARPDVSPESDARPGARPEPEARSEGLGEGGAGGTSAAYADRCYRSPAGMAGGVVLLALGGWLGLEAVFTGAGRTPWVAAAGLVCVIPLVVAFTLRPAVFAGEERLRVRNPFRTVTAPWGAVEGVRSSWSSELVADGTTYQLWSVPVSLRARKRATRHNERLAAGRPPAHGGGLLGRGAAPAAGTAQDAQEKRAPSDHAIEELRELAVRHGESPSAQGPVTVRWCYEILTPATLGALALLALCFTR